MNYKILVNKDYLYHEEDFSNRELKKVTNCLGEVFYLEKRTLKAYLKLKDELALENIFIDIVSGYISPLEHEELPKSLSNKYVPSVLVSEHYTGLCFDIGLIIDGKLISDNLELLEKKDIFETIEKYLSKEGLIIRYPKNKEEITNYNYEPWHYRYVGRKTASIINSKKLCLEEYDSLYNKSGVLLINKPSGITSRYVVNRVSQIFDTSKVGHNGTLDPLAEGVLVVTINKACKINELLTSEDKEYVAEVKSGILTDTLDIDGEVVALSSDKIDKAKLDFVIKTFPKKYLQEVPKFSAVKVNGKKLYEYARENKAIDLPKREVFIKELSLLDCDDTTFKFKTVVSKGTYIRSLINDIGNKLDVYLTMKSLIRTRQGKFLLSDTIDLDDVMISSNLISIKDALNLPIRIINDSDYKLISNGAFIKNTYNIDDKVLFVKDNREVAIYRADGDKLYCYKMLK